MVDQHNRAHAVEQLRVGSPPIRSYGSTLAAQPGNFCTLFICLCAVVEFNHLLVLQFKSHMPSQNKKKIGPKNFENLLGYCDMRTQNMFGRKKKFSIFLSA